MDKSSTQHAAKQPPLLAASRGGQTLPEIEARVCRNSVLLKILCEKRKGALVKIIAAVESLNLAVVTTKLTPVGSTAVDVTVNAEIQKEIGLATDEDFSEALSSALMPADDDD